MSHPIDSRRTVIAAAAACAALLALPLGAQAATVGQPAPDFTLTDTRGKPVKLSDFKGKHVVLEWTNPGCPYVVKHYGSQNMQSLQKESTAKGVVWLSISSTAQGHYDYLAPAALNSKYSGWGSAPTAHADGRQRQGRHAPMPRAPHRTCTSSMRRACWCMPAASTTSAAPIKTT